MQKEKQFEADCEEEEDKPDTISSGSDDAARRYYYDDAHGYEEYDPEKAEEDEED